MINVLFWLGMVLVGQLAAFLPVRGHFGREWLYWSIGLAVFGLFLLLFQRWATEHEDDGLSCAVDDGLGGQSDRLIELLSHHDD